MRRAISAFVRDESAQVLPEYAVVLVTVTLISLVAFSTISKSGSTLIQANANGMTTMNLANYQSP